MAIQKIMNSLIYGLSTDTKPITYATNTIWYEVDTGNIYVWSGSAWTLNDGASKTETLTNKTINASNNTITDTSAAVGDIMAISSGTAFKRLAMGSANQVLAVNAGGTAIGWATNSGSGAPTSSAYVTIGNDATLTAERALAVTKGLVLTDGGANSSVTLDTDPTLILKNRATFYDDCVTQTGLGSVGLSSGTGATFGNSNNNDVSEFGTCFLVTGSTASGSAMLWNNDANLTLGQGTLTVEWRIKVWTISSGTQQYVFRVGLMSNGPSSSADATYGVYFEYNQASNVNWFMCAANNGVRTKTASTQAFSVTYCRLKFVVNASANSVSYYYNDTLLGTVSTNIPPATTTGALALQMQIVKSVGTTSVTATADYVALTYDYTLTR